VEQDLFRSEKMDFNGLMLEYGLEGTSNFISWNDHMEVLLDDNVLLKYIKTNVAKPPEYGSQNLSQWKKDVAKVRRIILDGVRDHIVTNIHGKETPYIMWQTLKDLFQNCSDQRKMPLKDKLRNIKMQKNDTFPQYVRRFTSS